LVDAGRNRDRKTTVTYCTAFTVLEIAYFTAASSRSIITQHYQPEAHPAANGLTSHPRAPQVKCAAPDVRERTLRA